MKQKDSCMMCEAEKNAASFHAIAAWPSRGVIGRLEAGATGMFC